MLDALARLTDYGNDLLASVRDEVQNKPITKFGPANASGRLVRELRVAVSETATGYRLELFAPTYVLTLIYGRKPGKFPPLLAIEQWIQDKGIVPHPDAKGRTPSTKSLAYLIGRKIANKGNTVWQQGAPSTLFGDKLNKELVAKDLAKLLLPVFVDEVRTVLLAA